MKKLIVALLCAVALLLGSQGASALERIDVNSASIERLQTLPGIGAVRAAAIVAERAHQHFDSVDDLARVDGIGETLLAQLREQVTAAPRGSAK